MGQISCSICSSRPCLPSLIFVGKACGMYYKYITIVNYDSSIVNRLGAALADDARVIIYDRQMFKVQATGVFPKVGCLKGHRVHACPEG